MNYWRRTLDGLSRRILPEVQESLDNAIAPADSASSELSLSWAHAYGLHGDPSDAWDHAIKALEHALIPIVVPSKHKATLGSVLGELRANNGDKWRSSFPGKELDNSVEPLVGMLDAIWPNADRHGGGVGRPPTAEVARSVVALTAALLQAHLESPLVYKVS